MRSFSYILYNDLYFNHRNVYVNANYQRTVAQRPVEDARSQPGVTEKVTGTASVIGIGTASTVITSEMTPRPRRNTTDADMKRILTAGRNVIIATATTGIVNAIEIEIGTAIAMAIGRAMIAGGTGLNVTKIARTETIVTAVGHLFREARRTIHDTQSFTKVLRRENVNAACIRIVRRRYVMVYTFQATRMLIHALFLACEI